MSHEQLINPIKQICSESASFIRKHFRQVKEDQIESKSKNSLVSFVDQEAEKKITSALKGLFPEAGFITEEHMIKNIQKEYNWIVDPLDGTTNFIIGIPQFAISIGLAHGDEVILGVVYDVMQEDCYHAIRGKGAFVNDQKITVAAPKVLNDTAIATGFPYDKKKIGKAHLDTLQYFLQNARVLRRLGAAALDLCLVARASFDLYYEKHLNAWDLAAGSLIVEEAGGIVTDLQGKKDFLQKGEIIAYSPGMEEEAKYTRHLFSAE